MKKKILSVYHFFFKCLYFFFRLFNFKEKDVVIAGYKARYLIGNNLFLFNYLYNENPTDFNFYFYTKDKNVYKDLKRKYPGKIIYSYQLRTLLILLRAKVLVLISGYDDLSPYPLISKKTIINMWHGIPMKNIGYPSTKNVNKYFKLFADSIDYYTVSSAFDKEIIKNAFKLEDKSVVITGLQNNDFIKINQEEILTEKPYLNKKTIILYAPTFRENEMISKNLSDLVPLSELNILLEKYDALFLYRSHFNTQDTEMLTKYNRIKDASNNEFPNAQSLLYFTDILITDYSGIFFDFLLMDKPIVFYNYDFTDYKKHRGFIMDYEENTPGKKVQTQTELLHAIENYLVNPDLDSEFRIKIKNRFHKYTDGKACERTYQLIKTLI
jgi:CDP-glycerol glycerophosphotransferase